MSIHRFVKTATSRKCISPLFRSWSGVSPPNRSLTYEIMEVYDGYQVGGMAYYQCLWDEHDGWYFPEQDLNSIKVQ